MDEREIKGAAANAATAAYTTNPMEITKQALLSSAKKCRELSAQVDVWNNHVKFNISRGLRFMKDKAQTGAKAFTALDHSLSKLCNLYDI